MNDPISQGNAAAGIDVWGKQVEEIRRAQAKRDKEQMEKYFHKTLDSALKTDKVTP